MKFKKLQGLQQLGSACYNYKNLGVFIRYSDDSVKKRKTTWGLNMQSLHLVLILMEAILFIVFWILIID